MVSFWPFKGDDNSAASFEKILSQLSNKITQVGAENDGYRLRRRKYKVLWSLYSVFGYMLIVAILVMVIGFDNWTVAEYTVAAGGPPFIYAIRYGLDSYYAYRISNSQNSLDALVKQRETTIERLKAATKYNSTQQLLEKYGGSPGRQQQQQQQQQKRNVAQQQVRKRKSDIGQSTQSAQHFGRTGFAPPPTANIPGRQPAPAPATRPHTSSGFPGKSDGTLSSSEHLDSPGQAGEEFAPNAFAARSQPPPIARHPSHYATDGPKWYDRILDVMLGEDEAHARNRIVLICDKCRLVNGQAPPGTRSLEDVGRWRCGGCGVWNGVESAEKQMLKEMSQRDAAAAPPSPSQNEHSGVFADSNNAFDRSNEARVGGGMETRGGAGEAEVLHEEDEESGEDDHEEEEDEPGISEPSGDTPARSTRSKLRQRTQA